MTSISSQSSVGSGKSRRFLKLKLSLPVSSASLKHLSSGIFPDMVGFTCYKGNIGTLSRHLFRRLGDMLEISPRAITAHDWDALPISLWGLRGILACSRVFPILQHISSSLLKGSTPPPLQPGSRMSRTVNEWHYSMSNGMKSNEILFGWHLGRENRQKACKGRPHYIIIQLFIATFYSKQPFIFCKLWLLNHL